LKRDVDRLCAYYIIRALRQLGVELRAGECIAAASLYTQVVSPHHMVLGRFLQILEEDQLLKKTDSDWIVRKTPAKTDVEKVWRSIFSRVPAFLPELSVLRLCGLRLAEVLRGQTDPLELLFGQNSFIEPFPYERGTKIPRPPFHAFSNARFGQTSA